VKPRRRARPCLLAAALALWAAPALAGPLADALLGSQNYKVRLKAATELGKTRDPQGVAALLRALEDEAPLVRAAAVNSLGQLDARESTPQLCKLRGDADDFVAAKARETLELFGGASACTESKIFVEIEVNGADPGLRRFVENQLLQRAARDSRLIIGRDLDAATGVQGADPRAEVSAGRLPGVALSLKLDTAVQRGSSTTRIQCQLGQAVYQLRGERILKGSGTRSATIELGSGSVSDQAINGQMQECVSALVPVVYEGFGEYLKGVR
jgi:hypothetical protein